MKPCPEPTTPSVGLPKGKWHCTKCSGTGVVRCNSCRQSEEHRASRHFHRCECCNGEGYHFHALDTLFPQVILG